MSDRDDASRRDDSPEGDSVARRWLLTGRVQGVGFRHFTRSRARRIGVTGWVKNLPDGRVEIRVAGTPEEVAELKSRVREGPPAARVDRLQEETLEPQEDWQGFEVRF